MSRFAQLETHDATALRDGGESTRHAYEQMRALILEGRLEPGKAFSQVQLSGQLGVSRTPLREAIRLLQTQGLVTSEPNRRVRVAPLTTTDLEQLYAMRVALETLAVRLTVPKLTDADLTEIRSAFEAVNEALERGDAPATRAPHRAFHAGLFAHAGERLVSQVTDLWDHAERYRLLYSESVDRLAYAQVTRREHAAILESAEAGDAVECSRRLAEHLARTALTVLARRDGRHDPASIRVALDLVAAAPPDTPS